MTPMKQLSLFPTVSPCCLSAMLNDKQASKENHLCLYSGLIVVSWSTDFHLIILHEKGFWSFTGLGRNRENKEGESESTFCLAELPFTYEK